MDGAKALLKRRRGLQMELPIINLYRGSWSFVEAIEFMRDNHFVVSQIAAVSFSNEDTPSLVEADVIFRPINPMIDDVC